MKVADWVKKVIERDQKCLDCGSIELLRVIREGEGRTLCKTCFFKYHNGKKVSGKRPPKPLNRNSHRDRLWEEIERLRGEVQRYSVMFNTPQTNGQETRDVRPDSV